MKINKSELFDSFFTESKNRMVKHLVLHDIAAQTFKLAIEELKKHQVSAHYIIDLEGEIFQLVEESNIAHHAGVSYWKGEDKLNKSSIGIEFYNPNPCKNNFTDRQIQSGIKLCQNIINRYKIDLGNVVGHSDVAYFPENSLLNRKQDPSNLFPWTKFVENNVALLSDIKIDDYLQKSNFKDLKKKLKDFGYKIDVVDNKFDDQLKSVITVFKRRFHNL